MGLDEPQSYYFHMGTWTENIYLNTENTDITDYKLETISVITPLFNAKRISPPQSCQVNTNYRVRCTIDSIDNMSMSCRKQLGNKVECKAVCASAQRPESFLLYLAFMLKQNHVITKQFPNEVIVLDAHRYTEFNVVCDGGYEHEVLSRHVVILLVRIAIHIISVIGLKGWLPQLEMRRWIQPKHSDTLVYTAMSPSGMQ